MYTFVELSLGWLSAVVYIYNIYIFIYYFSVPSVCSNTKNSKVYGPNKVNGEIYT